MNTMKFFEIARLSTSASLKSKVITFIDKEGQL